MKIGAKLYRLRKKNNLTLAELASRCELTKGYLSQLENDITSPSIATLENILEVLGVHVSEFFQEEADEKAVFHKSDFFHDETEDYHIDWVIPNAQKHIMEPILLTLQPSGSSQAITPFDGEAFGMVLQGSAKLLYDSKAQIIKKGETFYVTGSHQHQLVNPTKQITKILWVITPPSF